MKSSFELLCHGHSLSETEAYQLFQEICGNKLNNSQILAIMAFYIARPITVNELMGFRNALLEMCIPVKLEKEAIDVCGTGGDQKNTFNIFSTRSCHFILGLVMFFYENSLKARKK